MSRAIPAEVGGAQTLGVFIDGVLRTGWYYPNAYDDCLRMDYSAWQAILRAGGLDRLCLPLGQAPYIERPWIKQPESGREFSPTGVLQVSGVTESVETDLVTMQVPFGYDGVINYVVATILPPAGGATNFSEGSGQITWRLKANGRHLRDWGNVQLSRGSMLEPTPIPGTGLRIYSGNFVELTVTLKATSGLTPTANLVGMIMGWFYPR